MRHETKCRVGRICGADLNGDNLWISRAYLRISDHCRVTVRVWVRVRIRVLVRIKVADCCIQTAGESDKMRINHVTKTDQWHPPADPHCSAFCRVPLKECYTDIYKRWQHLLNAWNTPGRSALTYTRITQAN